MSEDATGSSRRSPDVPGKAGLRDTARPSSLCRGVFSIAVTSLRAILLGLGAAAAMPAAAESPSAEFDRWLARAEQNDPDAEFQIGRFYERGYGRPRHYVLASSFFRKAAEKGHAEAAYRLGKLYLDGFGVPARPERAASWFEAAHAGGFADGATALGVMARYGIGGPVDRARAKALFHEAVEAGSLSGRVGLGDLLLEQPHDAGDRRRGRQHLEIAARAGLPEAMFLLAVHADDASTSGAIERAADAGFAPAAYAHGTDLVADGAALGRGYLYVAASEGHADAQYRLGLVHARGEGTSIDHDAATYWFGRAALSGHAEAQAVLGLSLARGRGIGRDVVAGAAWSQVAGARGSEQGREAATLLVADLKPAERELVEVERRRIQTAFEGRPPGADPWRFTPVLP